MVASHSVTFHLQLKNLNHGIKVFKPAHENCFCSLMPSTVLVELTSAENFEVLKLFAVTCKISLWGQHLC